MLAKFLSFKQLEKNTGKLAVLFLGSIEQHGPFMPLGTDTLIAEELAERLEKSLGKELVIYPVLPFGCAKEHQDFAGTIMVEYTTYINLAKDILNSLSLSGFKKVLLISTHGGNDLIAKLIQTDWNYDSLMKVEYMFAFDERVDKKTGKLFGGSEMHAGSSENSIVAFLYPNSVVFKGIKVDRRFAPKQQGIFTTFSTKEVTKLGIINFSYKLEVDPKKGRQLFEFIAANLVRRVKEIIDG